jgi:hypothetical protein
MDEAPGGEAAQSGEETRPREGRGASWLVRPLIVSALLIALPAYWVYKTIRDTEKPKTPEPPPIAMKPIDPAVEAAREKARQEEMAQEVPDTAKPGVEVISSRAVIDANGGMKILGTAKNNSDQNFEEVEIVFDVVNAQGQVVGTARAKLKNLTAKATGKFEASTFAPLPRGYRVESIHLR